MTKSPIRTHTLKKCDECDHWGLTYRTENELQTNPERAHNVLVTNENEFQRPLNECLTCYAYSVRTLCKQCAYRLWGLTDSTNQPYVLKLRTRMDIRKTCLSALSLLCLTVYRRELSCGALSLIISASFGAIFMSANIETNFWERAVRFNKRLFTNVICLFLISVI